MQIFFAEQVCRQFNEAICSSKFPATFKLANVNVNVTPKATKIKKIIIGQ